MVKLCDGDGRQAIIGESSGYWLNDDDFVSTASDFSVRCLGTLGFPRDWPACYSQNKTLKLLVGKKGRCAPKRVAVVAVPSAEDRAAVPADLSFQPLQSFANAERAEKVAGMSVIRGWIVFEQLDRPAGATFVAERYWWNALPDGKWVDFTPRPEAWPEVLLAEAAGASKSRARLTDAEAELAAKLLRQRFSISVDLSLARAPKQAPTPASPSSPPATKAARPATEEAKTSASTPVKLSANQVAAPLDYSKWAKIVDSDDEDDGESARLAAQRLRQKQEEYGVKDLAEAGKKRQQLPVPDYLVGNTGGGGGTNCFTSIARLLDQASKEKDKENVHQLAMAFNKIYHCSLMDTKRQAFYEQALNNVPEDAFVVVIGLSSILPMLRVARRGSGLGLLLETSRVISSLAEELLKVNKLSLPVAHVSEGLDKEEPVQKAIRRHIPKSAKRVVLLTEQFAHDLLSQGLAINMYTVHMAVKSALPEAEIKHIPKTAELTATAIEVRSERLGDVDIRPFNCLRHSTSNDKADFWWWPVRLDNQINAKAAILGPSRTLCGFDFDRCPSITFDEVRRTLKLPIEQRGRCNAVGLWWTITSTDGQRYSTEPQLAVRFRGEPTDEKPCKSEYKQAVHYLAGETAVFVGDTLELLVSITPRFTVRMMQQSPFSVESPPWVKAPTQAKYSATLPVLPYHFVMMGDQERLQVYRDAIKSAVQSKFKELGRRPRVLDCGCGAGLLTVIAALEGAEVWSCEAVPLMRQLCREVLSTNATAIGAAKGMVHLLPAMMSTRLQVGKGCDIEHKFDIIVSEVMDLWCLGEGVLPTMRHAKAKLLAENGLMLPSRLVIFAQPMELGLWNEPEKEHHMNFSPMYTTFKAKYSPLRIAQLQHRFLSDEPIPVLEVDLHNCPVQPADGTPNLEGGFNLCIRIGGKPALQAKLSTATIERSGMFSGYGFWWAADLGNGNVCANDPQNPQRSWKQVVRWLDTPRFVHEGEEVQVLACHSDHQVNIDDVYMPPEVMEQYQASMAQNEGTQQLPAAQSAAAAAVQAAQAKSRARAVLEEDVVVVD
mmetsp:Transcript_158119/g.291670  ORF Transcript_158119/g.291670 Transcript_158119/m.291670 type:complete len:1057 (-) Transcript_158119:452-3622(-)